MKNEAKKENISQQSKRKKWENLGEKCFKNEKKSEICVNHKIYLLDI